MRTSTLLSSILGYTKKLFRNAIFQILSLIVALGSIGITYAAWQTINSSEWAAGQPVTQTLVQKIINNLNDLDTRVNAIESNTTGGTVTWPLRWSSEYANKTYTQAWSACLALTPTGNWRVPSVNEIELGKRIDSTLFSGVKAYWSSSLGTYYGDPYSYYMGWHPNENYWYHCNGASTATTCSNSGRPSVVRCVSDAY